MHNFRLLGSIIKKKSKVVDPLNETEWINIIILYACSRAIENEFYIEHGLKSPSKIFRRAYIYRKCNS